METSSAPDTGFWRNIDLQEPFPRRGLRDSVFVHAALLGLLYAVSIWPQAPVHLADSRSYRTLSGYRLSPYLPELHGAPTHRIHGGKAEPVRARQEIRSLPDEPDNLRQTIVTPPRLKLQHDVELPNLVAYAPAPQAPSLMPQVVKAAPQIVQMKPRRALPNSQPSAVQPAPEADSIRPGSAPNLAQLLPPGADPVPPVPDVGDVHHASGALLLALSLYPAEVQPPVAIAEGNRSGAFAASPAGHADATGAPGAGDSTGVGAHDASERVNAPPGISVGASLSPAAAVAAPNAPSAKPSTAEPELRASIRPPAIVSIPPRQPVARETTGTQSELENRIFAGRRSYTLAVNMPNLNSATGSWIIHFVEREPGLAPSAITEPEVVRKTDPAYPGDLIRDGIKGTVVLTAIIRADGSVSDIVVVKSLYPQLDQNAVQALSRWVFLPALKNGQAIDLEAVITVPFRAKATGF